MIFQGLQRMVVPNDVFESPDLPIWQHWAWAIEGIGKLFSGQSLPVSPGDWYWNPSRVIPSGPGNEITEFPLFTFLYSDLHAHMIALPLTVLAIAWALSVLMARNMSRWSWLGALLFGGVVFGALRPTNTWDFPTYLVLGALVTGYAIFKNTNVGDTPRFGINPVLQRIFLALAGMGLLVGFSVLFYQPFANWYALGYSSFKEWDSSKTPIWSYLTHWGLFLFAIVSWMTWETRQWLAQTPLSELGKLKPYTLLIEIAIAAMLAVIVVLMFLLNATLAWLIMPLAFWALILILRPGQSDMKRLVLFMIGTALAITMVVEIVVLDGDIGRQNTIFKFYMQAWVLLAISSAAAVGWLISEIHEWSSGWRNSWYAAGGILLAGALLFTFTATFDKIQDRMAEHIPPTLDSITYMNYSTYSDDGQNLDLSHDYRAIRWMQENVKGSPVVLEAAPAGIQYAWYSRFSIYTGLPNIVGWEWHQVQQRVVIPDGTVRARGLEAQEIYRTNDLALVKNSLDKYDVHYIVVGQLERLHFPEGLAKFEEQNGTLWKEVYRDDDTVIYEVMP
jgi:YYY domain-containing protein